jgi:hypothetical protein
VAVRQRVVGAHPEQGQQVRDDDSAAYVLPPSPGLSDPVRPAAER